jgi:hypothetical protein
MVLFIAGIVGVGYWLQRNVPSEKNRVRHPQGYSVCQPQDWSAEVNYSDGMEKLDGAQRADGLSMMPDHFDGVPPKLFVNRFAGAPDIQALRSDGWEDGLFQGQPAFVREKKLPKGLTRGAIFQRSGVWFEVIEGLSVAGSVRKDEWWRFLETFRYPDGQLPATPLARSSPATGPASTEPFNFPVVGE